MEQKEDTSSSSLGDQQNKITSQKRNQKEIQSLIHSLKKYIKKSDELKHRVNYFFSSDDALDQVLYQLCKFIPKDGHILDNYDYDMPLNDERSEHFHEVEDSQNDDWTAQYSEFENISVNEYEKEGSKIISNLKLDGKKKYTLQSSCVEWKGYQNEVNGYAAVRISVPFVYKEHYTYVNRLVFFLFQKTNISQIEHFLSYHKFISKAIPLYMKCKNKLCVKLSHINASNEMYT